MKRPIPIHPFLFAAFPVLSIWSVNVFYVTGIELLLVLAVVLFAISLALLTFRVLTKEWDRAALPTTTFVIAFFTYDALYRFLIPHSVLGLELGLHRNVALLFLCVVGGTAYLARRLRSLPRSVTRGLNTGATVMVAVPLCVGVFTLTTGRAAAGVDTTINRSFSPTSMPIPNERPDVFHIVLDGYARADVLERVFGQEDRQFLKALEDRGFYVAREANANYPYTPLSFTSMFHMAYLDPLATAVGPDSENFLPINRALVQNPVWDAFEHLGYETYAFSSGYGWTQFRRADVWLSPGFQFTEFEQRIAALGPTKTLLGRVLGHSVNAEYRQRVRFALDELPDLADRPSPKYVFAHVACPHPPYAFEADGSDRNAKPQEYWWHDPEIKVRRDRGERIDEIVGPYAAQCAFISSAIIDAIDGILARSKSRPIILLHSDHGPDTGWHRSDPERADLRERFGILQAFLVDDKTRALLHPTISPVNTFRALFSGAFEQDLPLLPDRAFYVPLKRPYAPHEVTEQVR